MLTAFHKFAASHMERGKTGARGCIPMSLCINLTKRDGVRSQDMEGKHVRQGDKLENDLQQ